MEDGGRWAQLDAYLPAALRADLEQRFWRPIEAQAKLEALIDDPSFYADPGRHPAMFADHGVVHVRDVANGVLHLLDTVDGVLLSPRPPERRTFMGTLGVALAYLHDIGMVDMSPVGRRVHPDYAAHAAFWPATSPLVDQLLGPGPVRARLDDVLRALGYPTSDADGLRPSQAREERRQILEELREKRISADVAAQRLASLADRRS
jgi:hypothetical protein